ncbi:hypothetical protein Tco_0196070 [Tanacetum coccineum]
MVVVYNNRTHPMLERVASEGDDDDGFAADGGSVGRDGDAAVVGGGVDMEMKVVVVWGVRPWSRCNSGVTCEEEDKRRNSGAKTKTFEENNYLLLYTVSNKEDTAYPRQLITRIRVKINSRSGVSLFTYTPYAQWSSSQRIRN